MSPTSMSLSGKHANGPNVCVVKELVFTAMKWQSHAEFSLGSVAKSKHYSEILGLELYKVAG